MLPTLLAAAGVPDVKEQLLKGMKVGDKTFKVHLDGYNITDALAGKAPSPRNEFFYFNDDGSLVALRYNQWNKGRCKLASIVSMLIPRPSALSSHASFLMPSCLLCPTSHQPAGSKPMARTNLSKSPMTNGYNPIGQRFVSCHEDGQP